MTAAINTSIPASANLAAHPPAGAAAAAGHTVLHALRRLQRPKVAVFRALFLGDLLCSIPAFRSLRAALPHAHISLIGLPWAGEFVKRYSRYIDELTVFPGAPGLTDGGSPGAGHLGDFLSEARAHGFDLAIQMHGSGERSNPVLAGLGAKYCAGFSPAGEKTPGPPFLPWQGRENEVERCRRLMIHLGAPDRGPALELPFTREEAEQAHQLVARHGISRRGYVCVHPGARLPSRRWPTERFAAVATCLASWGYRVVVTGSSAEAALASAVIEAMPLPHRMSALNLAGRTTLGVLAAAAASARLIVCNDTGMSHIAAAVGTPSVVISSGGDARRWAPADSIRHPVLSHDVECRPCLHADCPIGHPCALGIAVDTVLQTVSRQLEGSPSRRSAHA